MVVVMFIDGLLAALKVGIASEERLFLATRMGRGLCGPITLGTFIFPIVASRLYQVAKNLLVGHSW